MDQQIRPQNPIDTTTNRVPTPLSERSTFKTLGQGVAICSLVGVISDLLTPINDGEILNYVLCIVIASLALAMVARRKFPAHRMDIEPAIAALLIGLVSLGGLKLVHVFYGTQNGLIADASPMTRELQQSLFRVEGKLIEIGRNLEGVQNDTTAIRETTKQIDSRTERIEEQTKLTKRETSDDPRKELANRGIDWTNESFIEALKSEDEETIDLFLRGNFNWQKSGGWPHGELMEKVSAVESSKIVELLVNTGDRFESFLCSTFEEFSKNIENNYPCLSERIRWTDALFANIKSDTLKMERCNVKIRSTIQACILSKERELDRPLAECRKDQCREADDYRVLAINEYRSDLERLKRIQAKIP